MKWKRTANCDTLNMDPKNPMTRQGKHGLVLWGNTKPVLGMPSETDPKTSCHSQISNSSQYICTALWVSDICGVQPSCKVRVSPYRVAPIQKPRRPPNLGSPIPFRTRYSARSVASMSALSPASIFSGLMRMVEITPVAIRMQSYTVSMLQGTQQFFHTSTPHCFRLLDRDLNSRRM